MISNDEAWSAANQLGRGASSKQSMRRTLRKSMPYLVALLVGTLAGACVAGFAFYAVHS
jgi:hypothetical protein